MTPPARLKVIGSAPAGRQFAGKVKAGEAVRIFTGAPLPGGADAVAIQENAEEDGGVATITSSVAPGRHVRPAGLDFRKGDVVMRRERLNARLIGVAAAMNRATCRSDAAASPFLPPAMSWFRLGPAAR